MQKDVHQANARTAKKTLLVAVAMFGFGFALIPLYSVLCNAFGLNGRFIDLKKTEKAEYITQVESHKDLTRTVKVEFLTILNQKLNWEFRALQNTIEVHPGVVSEAKFYAKNLTSKTVVAQAIPSITPGLAAKYFSKLECFCFTQQTFKPGEEREMLLRFYVDPHLPKNINLLSLGYTFFDTNRKVASNTEENVRKTTEI